MKSIRQTFRENGLWIRKVRFEEIQGIKWVKINFFENDGFVRQVVVSGKTYKEALKKAETFCIECFAQ